jgi:hypothetical protein
MDPVPSDDPLAGWRPRERHGPDGFYVHIADVVVLLAEIDRSARNDADLRRMLRAVVGRARARLLALELEGTT